ncbi:uncharacterized protein LOC114191395 [Vigna unguiculata]|uniref:uncharacterized protein LOC114191395 n=1 Tax=Vigna unguiculata TaxID=3917 RepID=UPI0010164724|nr:uncharacterized protein LOC114191395 [Vigna unguiculata]
MVLCFKGILKHLVRKSTEEIKSTGENIVDNELSGIDVPSDLSRRIDSSTKRRSFGLGVTYLFPLAKVYAKSKDVATLRSEIEALNKSLQKQEEEKLQMRQEVEAYYERKGKKKTCNLSTHNRDKFQERLDFKFYDFQALEIEKGWNNLFVSIISIETGETIAKSGKASVQNGKCHWEDSMLSTMWISEDLLQHNESFLLKLVVAMGSARFGTLGEAIINLASYIRPEVSTASLPLRQCSHGTILQVRILFLELHH